MNNEYEEGKSKWRYRTYLFAVFLAVIMALSCVAIFASDSEDVAADYSLTDSNSVTVYDNEADFNAKEHGAEKTLLAALGSQVEGQYWQFKAGNYNVTYKAIGQETATPGVYSYNVYSDDEEAINCGSAMVIKQSITLVGAVDGSGNPATVMYADYASLGFWDSSSISGGYMNDYFTANDLIWCKNTSSDVTVKNMTLMPLVYLGYKYNGEFGIPAGTAGEKWFTPNCTISSRAHSVSLNNITVVANTRGGPDSGHTSTATRMMDDAGNIQQENNTDGIWNLTDVVTDGGFGLNKGNNTINMTNVTMNFGGENTGDQRTMKIKSGSKAITLGTFENVVVNIRGITGNCRSTPLNELAVNLLGSTAPSLEGKDVTINLYTPVLLEGDLTIPAGVTINTYGTMLDANGHIITNNGELNVFVAKIGDVGYTSLAAAISAATEGQTIDILADCTYSPGQGADFAGTALTINGNGNTITMGSSLVDIAYATTFNDVNFVANNLNNNMFEIMNNVDVTFNGCGFSGTCSVEDWMNFIEANENYTAALTISDCMFDMTGANVNRAVRSIIDNGTVTVTNCVFIGVDGADRDTPVKVSGTGYVAGFIQSDNTQKETALGDPVVLNVFDSGSYKVLIRFTYTVTLNKDSGISGFQYKIAGAAEYSAYDPENKPVVNYGQSLEVKALLNDGYTFTQWASEITANPYTINSVTGNVTYNATSLINSYAVTATINNGGTVTNDDQTVNYGADAAQMVFTPATGYHFVSYSIDGAAAVDLDPAQATWSYTFEDVIAAHSIAVTTAVNTYTVTLTGDAGITGFQYKIDDAAEYTAYTVAFSINHGQKLVVNAVLADGYTFTQWASEITANPYTINSVTGNVTYNATSALTPVITDWNITIGSHTNGTIYEGLVEATSFTIDKSSNAKVYVNENEVIFYTGDDPTTNHLHVLSAAPDAGYAFAAWTGVQTAGSITADLTIGATFGPAYTGILKANNETATQLEQPILIGSPYVLLTKDEVIGLGFLYAPHTPVGFNTAADNSGTFFAFGATVTADQLASIAVENTVTIYVVWSHTVTYDVAGGSAAAPATAEVAAGPYTLAAYSGAKAGFTFGGWNDGSKVYAAGATYTMPYANVTFTAEWVAVTHTVTYDVAGGSAAAPTQAPVAEGGNFTVADYSGTKAGYIFGGWNDGTAAYAAGAVYAVGTANVTLTAVWNPISYTIAFDANGGTGTAMANIDATYDVEVALTANVFTKEGYAFGGWATTATGAAVYSDAAKVKNLTTTADATVTLYATWIQVEKKDNSAEITVTTDAVSDQAADQLVEAAKEIKATGAENVTVDVNATETESVSIKSDSVKEAVDNGIGVNIATSNGAMEFSSEALAGLVKTGETLKSEIKEIEVPPAYAEKIPADSKVFSITLTSNDVAITSFGSTFTVRIAYEASGNTDNLYVGYLAADGTIHKMDSYYENGYMVFTTDHLSDYAILEDSSSSANNQGLLLAILLIAAIVLPIIAGLVIYKKE